MLLIGYALMNRKKRREWILRGRFGPEHKFSDVEAVLNDMGYIKSEAGTGSHFVFYREGETEQKTVPKKHGKSVKKPYLAVIRNNALRIWGE